VAWLLAERRSSPCWPCGRPALGRPVHLELLELLLDHVPTARCCCADRQTEFRPPWRLVPI